mgnify:CR=1 FL=1
MISKTAYNKLIDIDSVSDTLISAISLPLTSSGSVLYCGGIKK